MQARAVGRGEPDVLVVEAPAVGGEAGVLVGDARDAGDVELCIVVYFYFWTGRGGESAGASERAAAAAVFLAAGGRGTTGCSQ